MTVSATYYGAPGSVQIDAIELSNVVILGVKREGLGFYESPLDFTLAPGGRDFQYYPAIGRILFADAFAGPTFGRPNRNELEKVWVLYKM